MKPIEPPEFEDTQRLVWRGNGTDVADLVARYDARTGHSYSVWALSFDERAAILDGANVILQVVGRQPAVALRVQGVDEQADSREGIPLVDVEETHYWPTGRPPVEPPS